MCNLSAALCFGSAPPLLLLAQVKLGGNKVKGARRMFFCLVHAYGRQTGRTSAPPLLPSLSPSLSAPALDESTGATGASSACVATSGGDGDATVVSSATPAGRGGGGVEPGSRKDDGVAAESSSDQVFRFWDEEANGTLVQAPLDLDRQGRGWCEVRLLPVCSCVRGLCGAFWRATARSSSG